MSEYKFCDNKDTCIHRRGCKRWVCNYCEDVEAKNGYVDDYECTIEYYENDCGDDHIKYAFDMLDRFRYSDGSEMR